MPSHVIQGPIVGSKRCYPMMGGSCSAWIMNARPFYDMQTENRLLRPFPSDTGKFSLTNTARTYFIMKSLEFGIGIIYPPKPWSTYSAIYHVPVGAGHGDNGTGWVSVPDLRTRLLLAIKDQKLSVGMMLAEYRSTASMFAKACRLVYHGYANRRVITARALKTYLKTSAWRQRDRARRRVSGYTEGQAKLEATQLLNGVSSGYLAYIFGWEQVARDLYGAALILSDRTKQPYYRTLSLSAVERTTITSSGLYGGIFPYQDYDQGIATVRAQARFSVSPGYQGLAQAGITNPAHVLYDAIPYSFVLNYLWPIGTYLQTLDALIGIEDLRWYHTKRIKVSRTRTMGGAKSIYLSDRMDRSPILTDLVAPLPGYKPSTALRNVLTGLALLTQIKTSRDLGTTFTALRSRRV